MGTQEIFAKLIQYQIKGLMIHEQLAEYYDFLGLNGYKRCHEYHYFEENVSYRGTVRYYIDHFNALVPQMPVDNPEIIPSTWYKYSRSSVDINTKASAVKNGMQVWKDWECELRDFLYEAYVNLYSNKEIASMRVLERLIASVDEELKLIERHCLELKAVDYDLAVIIPLQRELHNKYKAKMEGAGAVYD